jgi:transcriptional regulator with XRE-family HTH domain
MEGIFIRKGRTPFFMADILKIKQPSYARYEDGTTQPSLEKLVIIADTLGVSVDYLLGREEY